MARFLLDTNIVIMLLEPGRPRLNPAQLSLLTNLSHSFSVSTVSLWEIALKVRKGKLDFGDAYHDLESRLARARVAIIPLTAHHALSDADLPIHVKDPYDRMIAAVAEVEKMMLVTTDGALLNHPLAWRP